MVLIGGALVLPVDDEQRPDQVGRRQCRLAQQIAHPAGSPQPPLPAPAEEIHVVFGPVAHGGLFISARGRPEAPACRILAEALSQADGFQLPPLPGATCGSSPSSPCCSGSTTHRACSGVSTGASKPHRAASGTPASSISRSSRWRSCLLLWACGSGPAGAPCCWSAPRSVELGMYLFGNRDVQMTALGFAVRLVLLVVDRRGIRA